MNQQIGKHEEHIEHIAEEGKDFIEEPKQMNNLFPENSATDETSSKHLKEDHKNHDTLSMVIQNINSKKEERIQVLNPEGISLKPRTRLRSRMEAEMELIHNSRGINEDFGKLVIVNDTFSEENIHVSKEHYCLENENFIDLQGISGCIPERFCTSKQV